MIFLIAVSLFNLPVTSYAQLQSESLVVIDTALNSDQSDIAANIIYEVCILDWSVCPNGQNFMEGKGSAYLSPRFMSDNGFNHGSQMVAAALKTNPNLQIIFIRIVGNSDSGARLNVSPYIVAKALKWVSDNKEKFNISAVSMSQGHHNLTTRTIYCPTESTFESMADLLLQKGVPVFVPAGNSRDYERLDWPACFPSTVSIGALDTNRQISSYGNTDSNLLDYFETGEIKVLDFDGTERTAIGTSISVQVAAAKWMKLREYFPLLTHAELFEKLDNITTKVSNSKVQSGKAFPAVVENPESEVKIQSETDELNMLRIELAKLFSIIKDLLFMLKR